MTPLDLVILAVLALSAAAGFRGGLVAGVWGLLAWGLGLLVADAAQQRLAPLVVERLGGLAFVAPALTFVAALLVAEAVLALVGLVLVSPLRAIVRANPLTAALDRLLGVVVGATRGLVVAGVGLTVAVALPIDAGLRASIEGSPIARLLVAAVGVARSLVAQ